MPLYEYTCRDCGHRFEFLTRDGQSPRCPSCASDGIQKQLSTFAVSAGGTREAFRASDSCGRCGDPRGPGSCAIN